MTITADDRKTMCRGLKLEIEFYRKAIASLDHYYGTTGFCEPQKFFKEKKTELERKLVMLSKSELTAFYVDLILNLQEKVDFYSKAINAIAHIYSSDGPDGASTYLKKLRAEQQAKIVDYANRLNHIRKGYVVYKYEMYDVKYDDIAHLADENAIERVLEASRLKPL